eukprot:TRINITY_DN9421_c0_g1_i1.p5 TRINITY_DN9421_c0_g1~~TRINITY_DN9421_c0_g1_i1.p5  ORF type:complete len:135 (+),score=10.41 TRINITY_DN9421_c0_g1_i1:767-1171(+)
MKYYLQTQYISLFFSCPFFYHFCFFLIFFENFTFFRFGKITRTALKTHRHNNSQTFHNHSQNFVSASQPNNQHHNLKPPTVKFCIGITAKQSTPQPKTTNNFFQPSFPVNREQNAVIRKKYKNHQNDNINTYTA